MRVGTAGSFQVLVTVAVVMLWCAACGIARAGEIAPVLPALPDQGLRSPSKPEFSLNRNALKLKVGETFQLVANTTAPGMNVRWSSFNPGFATVSPNGLVTAVHEGVLKIEATAGDFDAVSCNVEVVAAPPPVPVVPAAPYEIKVIRIANEIPEMIVGEELGIVAACLPYNVFEDTPYSLETDNPAVVQVNAANIAKAVGAGTVTLTVRTPNGVTDSISFPVKPVPEVVAIPPEGIYTVEPGKFKIVLGEVDTEQSIRNTAGINHVLLYAKRWGYRKVVFPNGLYQLDPMDPVSMRSNLEVDLNGSTWQIKPNAYARYALIRFAEVNEPNLFESFDMEMKPATNPDLSPPATRGFALPEGKTSLLSNPILVGNLPPKDGSDQFAAVLERGALIDISSPFSVKIHHTDPEISKSMSYRFRLNYYKGEALVTTKDFGSQPPRNTVAKLWCDMPQLYALRTEEDYDRVRLELQFSLDNCTADAFFRGATISKRVSAVLENSRLCNGTILGERDFKEQVVPGWKSNPQTEGALAISFDEGENNGIESLTVRKSIGFNMGSRLGQRSAGAVGVGTIPLKWANLEFGDFDADGNASASATVQRTKDFMDFSAIRKTFELGLPLGYVGYNILRVRVYDILFFDADKTLIERRNGRMAYRKYTKPANAMFVKLVLYWDVPITVGHPDFSNAIGFITSYTPPYRNYIRNCVIEDNYSCGWAACGGINWRIEGNTFRRNGGRMPGCDIDWEDGWEYTHDDVIRNNSFESHSGLIVCAGINHIFLRNTMKGNTTVYGRSQYLKFVENRFGEEGKPFRASFGTQTETYIVGNTFLGGTVSLEKQHGDAGKYKGLWLNNEFKTGAVLRNANARNDVQADNTFAPVPPVAPVPPPDVK